jgi:hypothetical protein
MQGPCLTRVARRYNALGVVPDLLEVNNAKSRERLAGNDSGQDEMKRAG